MRKTLFRLSMIAFALLGMQSTLTAQEKTPLNQVVNTLKERISLAGYAQLGYTYDDAADPDNTFDIKRIIFMAHGKITDRWTCDFMYDSTTVVCCSKYIQTTGSFPDLQHVSENSKFLIPLKTNCLPLRWS